jgi:RNA polymerase sigma-70 factor (ECF subfamily)
MDTDAFRDAFESYSDELFRHALMRLNDRERALELVQECFMRSMEYTHKGGEIEQMRPFLYRTLRHLIIDEYRRHKATSLEAMAEGGERDVEDYMPPDEGNTLEAAIDRHEGARALEALKSMQEPYRETLMLRYVESLSIGEIASAVGESENVVSVRLHRGLKKLRAILEHEES